MMATKKKVRKPVPMHRHQYGTLVSLHKHGSWHRKSCWIWSSRDITEKALEALVRKGFANVGWIEGVKHYTPIDCPLPPVAKSAVKPWKRGQKTIRPREQM